MSRICSKCKRSDTTEWYNDSHLWCKPCRKEASNKNWKRFTLDYWIVYYLEDIHYCGITINPENRMIKHRKSGSNCDFKVLKTCKTKKEAIYYEALFCSTLGINGL